MVKHKFINQRDIEWVYFTRCLAKSHNKLNKTVNNIGIYSSFCKKTSILNIIMTSVSGLPHDAVLLKYMDSKMIRKSFQSIKESISASLSPTN